MQELKREYFKFGHLQEAWSCSVEDIIHNINTGKLRASLDLSRRTGRAGVVDADGVILLEVEKAHLSGFVNLMPLRALKFIEDFGVGFRKFEASGFYCTNQCDVHGVITDIVEQGLKPPQDSKTLDPSISYFDYLDMAIYEKNIGGTFLASFVDNKFWDYGFKIIFDKLEGRTEFYLEELMFLPEDIFMFEGVHEVFKSVLDNNNLVDKQSPTNLSKELDVAIKVFREFWDNRPLDMNPAREEDINTFIKGKMGGNVTEAALERIRTISRPENERKGGAHSSERKTYKGKSKQNT